MVIVMPKSLRPGEGYHFAGGAPALLPGLPLSGVFASSSSGLKSLGRRHLCHRPPLKVAERGSESFSFHTSRITAVIRTDDCAATKQSDRSDVQPGRTPRTPAGSAPLGARGNRGDAPLPSGCRGKAAQSPTGDSGRGTSVRPTDTPCVCRGVGTPTERVSPSETSGSRSPRFHAALRRPGPARVAERGGS